VYSGATPKKASRDHTSIVKNNKLIAPQEIRKLAEQTIFKFASAASQGEQAGRIPPLKRMLGDSIGRERIIELIETHG